MMKLLSTFSICFALLFAHCQAHYPCTKAGGCNEKFKSLEPFRYIRGGNFRYMDSVQFRRRHEHQRSNENKFTRGEALDERDKEMIRRFIPLLGSQAAAILKKYGKIYK